MFLWLRLLFLLYQVALQRSLWISTISFTLSLELSLVLLYLKPFSFASSLSLVWLLNMYGLCFNLLNCLPLYNYLSIVSQLYLLLWKEQLLTLYCLSRSSFIKALSIIEILYLSTFTLLMRTLCLWASLYFFCCGFNKRSYYFIVSFFNLFLGLILSYVSLRLLGRYLISTRSYLWSYTLGYINSKAFSLKALSTKLGTLYFLGRLSLRLKLTTWYLIMQVL